MGDLSPVEGEADQFAGALERLLHAPHHVYRLLQPRRAQGQRVGERHQLTGADVGRGRRAALRGEEV